MRLDDAEAGLAEAFAHCLCEVARPGEKEEVGGECGGRDLQRKSGGGKADGDHAPPSGVLVEHATQPPTNLEYGQFLIRDLYVRVSIRDLYVYM